MPSISLGNHFESFVQEQITGGRYQNASEVVRAGLRLLEDHEASRQERFSLLKAEIDSAWDDPAPSRSADDVFSRLEKLHAEMVASTKTSGA